MTYNREATQRTKKLKTKTKRLHSAKVSTATTGCSTAIIHSNKAATISNSKPCSGWSFETCPRRPTGDCGDASPSMTLQLSVDTAAAAQSLPDAAPDLHDEATDDVTPSTSDVISSSGDVVNDDEKNKDEAACSSSDRVLHYKTLPSAMSSPAACQRKQFNTVHVERPTNRSNLTSSSGSQHNDDTQDDKQPPAAGQRDDNTYQKLGRSSWQWQRSSGEYTELRPQSTRDSVISDASYESIARSTIRSCHAAAYTSDNDALSIGEYLHPMSVYAFTPWVKKADSKLFYTSSRKLTAFKNYFTDPLSALSGRHNCCDWYQSQ